MKILHTYNDLNQLTQYQSFPDNNPASIAIKDYSYTYGPLGRRWSKRNNLGTELTQFYWSGSNLIAENHNGTPRYYILEGLTPSGFIENGETYHYLKDHLGTAHEVIDNSGTIIWQGDYRSFGAVMEAVSLVNNRLRFAGQYFDTESGLHYNNFRDYDPAIGRYLQSDPIGLWGGLNTYGYVYQNPVNYVDDNGLKPRNINRNTRAYRRNERLRQQQQSLRDRLQNLQNKVQKTKDIAEGIAEIQEQLKELDKNLNSNYPSKCARRICPWDPILPDLLNPPNDSFCPAPQKQGPRLEPPRDAVNGCKCVSYVPAW